MRSRKAGFRIMSPMFAVFSIPGTRADPFGLPVHVFVLPGPVTMFAVRSIVKWLGSGGGSGVEV
jgi:hypothetical protein